MRSHADQRHVFRLSYLALILPTVLLRTIDAVDPQFQSTINGGETLGSDVVISWASHPILPGEVLVLQGSFPPNTIPCETSFGPVVTDNNRAAVATGSNVWVTTSVLPLQQTPVSLKVRVPTSVPHGAFNVSACGSQPITVNLPDVWWILGDRGDTATPGGWLRTYGLSITVPQTRST